MRIVKEKDVDVFDVVRVLKRGGIVIYPTETMYGVGVDATNPKAVKKLNRYKKRPAGKPYSIMVKDILMAKKYVYINKSAEKIYYNFLPGPITVVSKGKHQVAKGVESETGTLGVRIPDYKLVLQIVDLFKKPITATSANASYKKRPYNIFDILNNLGSPQKKLIDLIIDAGELPHRDPSTVVDTTCNDFTILRQGNVKFKENNEITSMSPEETKNFAKELWQKYEIYNDKRAIIFALSGEMGSGKTVFTKGLARAMGIKEVVTSPTFNLESTYVAKEIKNKLVHIDVWRIFDSSELDDLGYKNHITDKSILAIEWADKIVSEIQKCNEEAIIVWINISFSKRQNQRIIHWGVSK